MRRWRAYWHESVLRDRVTYWPVIASDHRERGNLTVVVLKDCEIASVAPLPRNDAGEGDRWSNDAGSLTRQRQQQHHQRHQDIQ